MNNIVECNDAHLSKFNVNNEIIFAFTDKDGKPVTLMTVTLSYDRRAIDEFDAANFLDVVREMLEEPALMLLGGQQSLRSKLGV